MGAVKTLLPDETDPALDMLRREPELPPPLDQRLRRHLDRAEEQLGMLRRRMEHAAARERTHAVPAQLDLQLAERYAAELHEALRGALCEYEMERDHALAGAPWGQW